MDIIEKPIKEIIPYEKNAKKHPNKQIKQVAESISAFGFAQPIVVDKNNVIIVGHGRLEAAKLLDLQTVPVLVLDIDEEKAKAYRLGDNKLNESDWDMDLVVSELKELSLPMLDLTGFSRDLILENSDADDQLPETPVKPKSKLGDIYEIGNHKVICGDSTDPETYKKLMGDQSADMVFTDPPYNVNYSGRGKETSRTIENDNMEALEFDSFLEKYFKASVDFVKNGGGWYVFHSSSTQHQFQQAMETAELKVRAQLIWNKPTASMGWGDYRWKHEPCFYAGKKESKLTFYGDRTHKTVLDFQRTDKELAQWAKRQKRAEVEGKTTIWTMKRDSLNSYRHPTQKPVELITYAIANSSKEDDLILDSFLGSGSTIIAAEKAHRKCYGVELDPSFVDVVVQRFVDFTGKQEVIKNGKVEVWEIENFTPSAEPEKTSKKEE